MGIFRKTYSTMGYAFSFTAAAVLALLTGLSGYRLNGHHGPFLAESRWSGEILWEQVVMGLAFTVAAIWCWRKGLREIRSGVHVPELAGRDGAAPPSRRIERR